MQRPSVDLPQPDSPTRPSASPGASSRSTPSTARRTAPARPGGRRRPTPPRSGKCIDEVAHLEQRLSHRRSPAPVGRLRRRASGWMHAVARPPPSGRSGNAPSRQSGCTNGQRGWKRQPGGGAARSGGAPGIVESGSRTTSKSGTERSRPSVYGCRGSRNTVSTGPVSTTWPAYMTATRWQVCAITARSCETKTMLTPSSLAQRCEQLQDLVLDRDVERRRRLVAEDQLRLARERDRDHHALAHAARELVRVGVGAPLRIGDADQAHQLERALARAPPAVAEPHERALGDLLADAHHRVQRRHRLLEDHRDRAAAQLAPRVLVEARSEVDALELDRAAGDASRRAAAGRRARAASSSCRSRTRRRARAPRRGRRRTTRRRRRAATPRASGNSTRRSRTRSSGVAHSGLSRSASPSASSDRPSAVITTAIPGIRRELPVRGQVRLPVGDHPAPVRRRRLHAEPEIAERDDREDVEHDVRHREDDRLRDHVRQQVADEDARVRQPAGRAASTYSRRLATSTSPRMIRVYDTQPTIVIAM